MDEEPHRALLAHKAKLRGRVPRQNSGLLARVPGPTTKLRGPGLGPGSHDKTQGSQPGSQVPQQNPGVPAWDPDPKTELGSRPGTHGSP